MKSVAAASIFGVAAAIMYLLRSLSPTITLVNLYLQARIEEREVATESYKKAVANNDRMVEVVERMLKAGQLGISASDKESHLN